MNLLTQSQISRTGVLFNELMSSWIPVFPIENEMENAYTARVLYPLVRNWVGTLNKSGLYCRGNGGPSVQPIVVHGLEFYPDIEIVMDSQKVLSIEVKFIRDQDSNSSITKGLGQGLLYQLHGYETSFVLFFDLRLNALNSRKTNNFRQNPISKNLFSYVWTKPR